MITFITKGRPLSYNNKHKSEYQLRLRQQFELYKSDYPEIPLDYELRSKLVYSHKIHHHIADVDNISKPFSPNFPCFSNSN